MHNGLRWRLAHMAGTYILQIHYNPCCSSTAVQRHTLLHACAVLLKGGCGDKANDMRALHTGTGPATPLTYISSASNGRAPS